MKGDDIVLSDVGAHKMWVAREYNCTEPNTCLISNGFCTMVLLYQVLWGRKWFSRKKSFIHKWWRRFFYECSRFRNRLWEKLNVVAVVWLDGEYGLIKWKQQIQFDGDHSNLTFDNPDFGTLAKSLNMWGVQINSADNFTCLERSIHAKGPIIGVPVDYSENMRLTKHLGKVSQVLWWAKIYFLYFLSFFSDFAFSKVCELSNIRNLKSLEEKIKICDEGDRLYLTYDIKIKTEKLIVNLCSLKDTIISKEEINIVHKRNSGVSLICIYMPNKEFFN